MKNTRHKTKKRVVAISGGFDPVHIGHIRHIQEAKKLGDELIVIMNNDNWLKVKKGYVFMPQDQRKEIIEAIQGVDRVVLTKHGKGTKDYSICDALREVRPDIFAKGGDRDKADAANPRSSLYTDIQICKELGIEIVFNVGRGGKVQSSSWLTAKYFEKDTHKTRDSKNGVDHIGVTCVFFCHDGKGNLLMQKRSQECRDERGRWDCGSGSMEFGETFEETVRREIKEEYCVNPIDLKFCGVRNVLRKNGKIRTHWVALVFAAKVDPKRAKIGEKRKIEKIGLFPIKKLPSPQHSMLKKHLATVRKAGVRL